MSAYCWRNRWIHALVHNGIDHSTAEALYASTYRDQSEDQSKSPELQALMVLTLVGDKAKPASRASA